MIDRKRNMLTLAMYLNSRGFSFVLFEGTLSPYDWGMFEYCYQQWELHLKPAV
jgi:hypothetical protein